MYGELTNTLNSQSCRIYFYDYPNFSLKNFRWSFMHDSRMPIVNSKSQIWLFQNNKFQMLFEGNYIHYEDSGFKTVGTIKTQFFINEVIHFKKISFTLLDFL